MEKQKIQHALASNNFDDMLEVYNHFKTNEKFKNVILKHNKFFNSGSAKPGEVKFSILLKIVKDIYRILEHSNYFVMAASKPPEIKVTPLTLDPKNKATASNPDEKNKENKNEKPKIVKNPVVNYKELPENLQKLYDEAGALKTEMKSLHAKMVAIKGKDINSNKARKKLVTQIAKNEEKFKENFEQIDAWWLTNKTAK